MSTRNTTATDSHYSLFSLSLFSTPSLFSSLSSLSLFSCRVIKVLRLKPADGKLDELCGRVVLPWRDEGATRCFFADVRVCEEWQYKDILNDIDDLMWEDLSEDWQKYVSEGGESPAL